MIAFSAQLLILTYTIIQQQPIVSRLVLILSMEITLSSSVDDVIHLAFSVINSLIIIVQLATELII